ncbi:Transposase DDE domain-containing protein [Pseudobutyrivibrio sp. UC1225]|uniref:IS4 family transposase n=1 Tax=Pseudobutyrivibrio sp. UC1225 TaxID=1798185 RepID=UPI0008EEB05B|nr:IS4 family transposase [Pseudobutyrivibrio sp. UC1225]SFN67759.1 Transposase DDE domain-containing protein [Pseudobutyrivibrio sp. UC1225]
MKPQMVKKLLMSQIKTIADNAKSFCIDSERNFSRKRKLSMEKVITGIIGMGSGSLTNELLDLFNDSSETPTASAFCQQRSKITVEAFEAIFRLFSKKLCDSFDDQLPILAIDGSKIQIPTNPDDVDSYLPGTNGQKPYNLLHLNALYNLQHQIYQDAIIQKSKYANEHLALVEMVDRSLLDSALLMADRGYESYNNLAHIQEKGWYFLFRIKDGICGIKQGLSLPNEDSYDISFELNLTRKQTNKVKELLKDKNHYRWIPNNTIFDYLPNKNRKGEPTKFYKLSFRIVRFQLSEGSYETIITNLPNNKYPPEKIKKLYALRWGIETSFRDLKYTMGMLDFHTKKVECIQQELYAHLIMYNFAEMITSHVVIKKKQRKYTYKANFSVAAHMCRKYYRGITSPPDLETIISRNLVPIRPDRHRVRYESARIFRGFLYRVA